MTDPREPISIIEDLDPEHDGRGEGWRLDLLLGVALLLAVVLFAGWQWWRQDYQSSQYRAGQEAAGRNDWEAARRYFTEASDYTDADALAKNASEKITERDRLYTAAGGYAENGQWLRALSDLRDLGKIQPGYKDIRAREEVALLNVYSDALSGTVVLRQGAEPPGLYYRDASGWVWLKGSDANSRWMADYHRNHIVFDVPIKGWIPTPTATPLPQPGQYDDTYPGRQFVRAQFDGADFQYTKIAMDPSYYFPLFASESGFWGWRANSKSSRENWGGIISIVRDAFWTGPLVYQSYSGDMSATIALTATLDSATGSTIVFVDPGSNRYLLAEWANASGSSPDSDTVVRLYLAAAGTEEKRLVYTHIGGGFESAQISPDGRYVILHTYAELEQPANMLTRMDKLSTVLVDVEGRSTPRTLMEARRQRNPYMEPQENLTAAFIREGAYAGKLLLAQDRTDTSNLQIIDPVKATGAPGSDYKVAEITVEGDIAWSWVIREQNAGGLLLTKQEWDPRGSSPTTSTLSLAVFPAEGSPSVVRVETANEGGVVSARTAGCHIIWSTQEYESPAEYIGPPIISVYTIHKPGAECNGQGARQVFSTRDFSDNQGAVPDSAYLGDRLLAYVVDGELHARTYDDQVDLALETGVPTVFDSTRFNYSTDALR